MSVTHLEATGKHLLNSMLGSESPEGLRPLAMTVIPNILPCMMLMPVRDKRISMGTNGIGVQFESVHVLFLFEGTTNPELQQRFAVVDCDNALLDVIESGAFGQLAMITWGLRIGENSSIRGHDLGVLMNNMAKSCQIYITTMMERHRVTQETIHRLSDSQTVSEQPDMDMI